MSSSAEIAEVTVLITGSNRGLGRALATRFLLQPRTTVVAAVRQTDHATMQSLSELPRGSGSELITVKIDSLSDSDAPNAVELLQTKHGIQKLDIVVANAGYGTVYGDLSQVRPGELRDLFDINAVGPLRLFQAVRPLLEAGNRPRFVLIGTPIASIAAMEKAPFPMIAYGASKAAAHYLARKMHCERARNFGMEQAPVPVDDSADFVFAQIGKATREETSGKFVTIDESQEFLEW
ncbi:secondary metabolism biosynthetic enzyme [Apiospora saccharicola]|uniref:Secondary metabolism biosynthetic enzyme n=1 Tax=Apiospora saccharicola TaxID=335842 RepID=A0ABR1W2D2_9PEZI